MNASFEEKSTWIQLISILLALGGYFALAGVMLAQGVFLIDPYVPLFALAVVGLVIINVAGHAAAAIVARPEARDERDRLIAWRAESNSGWILGIGVLLGITGLLFSIEGVLVAHVLLSSLFLAEAARCAFQLLYYRRGM